MATSIEAQLQRLASYSQPEQTKRASTRPSIIHDPIKAADIGLDTILTQAISGLEVLMQIDSRFGSYENSLFSLRSRDSDRELLGIDENNKINESISSYLRLISGHLQLYSAIYTLEYLIRRYKVHVYNIDELILCALPYHDTHAFVRIVQLLELGNSKWKFLEGVKVSGAPPPRNVIVQQCIRDLGVFDIICKYASPMKKYQPSVPVVNFFTAVAVEFLGALPVIDSDVVRRILPFVFSGFEPKTKGGRDHKAGALMMVGLLSNRAALNHKPVKTLIESIARVACQDSKESADLPWLRMLLMAIISLVQSQSVEIFPKKVLEILQEIREFDGVLLGLSREFNIKRFLSVYLDSLATYSSSEHFYHLALLSAIDTFLVKDFINNIVAKVLSNCLTLSKQAGSSKLCESGCWAKQILVTLGKKYPSELQRAIHRFLEDPRVKSNKECSGFENLGTILGGDTNATPDISDSMMLLTLEHPKAEIRRATLSSLVASGTLKLKTPNAQIPDNIQEAILRRLRDEDLSVIKTALSLKGLSDIIDTPNLIGALGDVLLRCIDTIMTSASPGTSEACDVAILCLDCVITNFQKELDYSKGVASMIFPLLLIFPKTWSLNVKALELAKGLQCPLYSNISDSSEIVSTIKEKESSISTSVNMTTVQALAEAFSANPEEHMTWLIECANRFALSKTLLLLVILQSFVIQKEDPGSVFALFRTCFPFLKLEWNAIESLEDVFVEGKVNSKLDEDVTKFFGQLLHRNCKALHSDLLICTFWRLLNAFITTASLSTSEYKEELLDAADTLFIFFAGSRSKNVFKEHIYLLVQMCNPSPVQFLSKIFTEEGYPVSVQVESLLSFASICSHAASTEKSLSNSNMQLLLGFPSILVPFSCDNKDIRKAAMNCIEALNILWHQIILSSGKNGNDGMLQQSSWSPFLGELLELLVEQKRLILSDKDFLQSLFAAVLGSSSHNISAPQNIDGRFDERTKEAIFLYILSSALKFCSFGKLMVLQLLRGKGNAIVHVESVKSLLSGLLERRNKYHCRGDKSCQPLSKIEIQTLCFLLESCAASSVLESNNYPADRLIEALQVDSISSKDLAVVQPCVTVLRMLNSSFYGHLKIEIQDQLFEEFVFLFRSENSAIQNAARDAILRLNVNFSTVARLLDLFTAQEVGSSGISSVKKKKKSIQEQSVTLHHKVFYKWESRISFLGSLLDVLLLKKDINNRSALTGPLFKLLGKIFPNEQLLGLEDKDVNWLEASSGVSQSLDSTICYIQQTLLTILDDISITLLSDTRNKEDVLNKFDVKLLLKCARETKDATTLNHVFSLVSSISKVVPDKVLKHIIGIFTVIGGSAVKQGDSHSQHVFEDLISTIVPFWLSKENNVDDLLQIFIGVLPEISEHRRLTIMVFLLRTLGERRSLASLLVLLFRSAGTRKSKSESDNKLDTVISVGSTANNEWEYEFALEVCTQYSCIIWLPSLAQLLEQIRTCDQSQPHHNELLLAVHLVSKMLQETELIFKLESGENSNEIQKTLGSLMEQVVSHLQLVNAKSFSQSASVDVKKELRDTMHSVLKSIINKMLPSSFFVGINLLLGRANGFTRKKALKLLSETVKSQSTVQLKHKEKRSRMILRLDEKSTESFTELCSKIIKLIDTSDESPDTSIKLAAIKSVEDLANSFPSNGSMFTSCLTSILNQINSQNLSISCNCLQATAALIKVLDIKDLLPKLPQIMKITLNKARADICNVEKSTKESLPFSILITLEAIIENLGRFLSPYLSEIVELMILYPDYFSGEDLKIKAKADTVRRLLTEKIEVRNILSPLLEIYQKAVDIGESSVSLGFGMLATLISKMDRLSVGSNYKKVFKKCLLALDLRRVHPDSVKNVDIVEKCVVHAMIVLSLKLTETMFKPLFIDSLEWSGTIFGESASLDRIVSFYRFVNELVENQRSLFVPYFKYLLDSCTRYLTDSEDTQHQGVSRKSKKAKLEGKDKRGLSLCQWHIRALVLSSLQKCFLYDTGSNKFLDSSNFQVLLKPIVSQLVAEPPNSVDEITDVPSVKEVDDTLVACLGQMAVTAGSDLLWKPLNHEVLMQSRSEKVRTRVLALRVVKYLVDHLKDEYLVLLPETIPFLGELLEDIELPVKSLAQEIFKEMEVLSGESLRQYL
ncbi:hypothetical protein ACHQM5_001504 [Ranunculus cassubicifolius]